jgi:hypothetical protein
MLALGATSASAAPWAITINADYTHVDVSGFNADGYHFGGAAEVPLNWSNVSVEADLNYSGLAFAHDLNVGGSVIWNDPMFRLAGTVEYNHLTFFGVGTNETQYGAGGEWYVNPWLTASLQGGGVSGGFNAGYVGGGLKGYICPNFSVGGSINYLGVSGGHEVDYGVKAEWQVSDTFPVAVNGGYTRSELSGGGPGFNVWSVGLTLHLNGGAPTTLVDTNRTGTLDTIGAIHPIIYSF